MDKKGFFCKLPGELIDMLEAFSRMSGKPKTFVVETALKQYLYPYSEDGRINPVPAIYRDGPPDADIDETVLTQKRIPCYILGDTVKFGKPYKIIYMDGHLRQVPENKVSVISENQ